MPYERVGAAKVSDHWVRSPLLNLNRARQTCHAVAEKELEARVLATRTGTTRSCSAQPGPPPTCSMPSWPRRRPAPASVPSRRRILGEVIDHSRQGQLEAEWTTRKK
jgi:hypothetical protein